MKPKALLIAVIGVTLANASAFAQALNLPDRETPRPETTTGIPHKQIGVEAIPELSEELVRRVAKLSGVTVGPTRISLPGATGFQFKDNLSLERPEAIVGGREFAHVHPDGSLHAALEPATAKAAVKAGWATPHPWSTRNPNWSGFVMIYTPKSEVELEVVYKLVQNAYTYVSGNSPTE